MLYINCYRLQNTLKGTDNIVLFFVGDCEVGVYNPKFHDIECSNSNVIITTSDSDYECVIDKDKLTHYKIVKNEF